MLIGLFGLFGVVLMAVGALYYGWATSIMWNWFAVPLGAPQIGVLQAYGLMLLVAMFKDLDPSPKSEEEWRGAWSSVLFKPLFALGIGYVVKAFM